MLNSACTFVTSVVYHFALMHFARFRNADLLLSTYEIKCLSAVRVLISESRLQRRYKRILNTWLHIYAFYTRPVT